MRAEQIRKSDKKNILKKGKKLSKKLRTNNKQVIVFTLMLAKVTQRAW